MLRTIVLGSCVTVQGRFIRQLQNGRILIQVGERLYAGMPIAPRAA